MALIMQGRDPDNQKHPHQTDPHPVPNLTETTVSSYFWPPSVKPSNFYPSGACADAAGGWGTAPLPWPKICWYCIKDVRLWRTCPSFALSGSPCQEQPITSNQLVVIQIKVIKVIDHGFHQLKIHLVPQDACEGKKKEKQMHSEWGDINGHNLTFYHSHFVCEVTRFVHCYTKL